MQSNIVSQSFYLKTDKACTFPPQPNSKEARRKWGLLFGIVNGRMLSRPLLEESSYDLSSRGDISEQFDEEFCVDDNEDASERMSSVEVTIMGGPLKA